MMKRKKRGRRGRRRGTNSCHSKQEQKLDSIFGEADENALLRAQAGRIEILSWQTQIILEYCINYRRDKKTGAMKEMNAVRYGWVQLFNQKDQQFEVSVA